MKPVLAYKPEPSKKRVRDEEEEDNDDDDEVCSPRHSAHSSPRAQKWPKDPLACSAK